MATKKTNTKSEKTMRTKKSKKKEDRKIETIQSNKLEAIINVLKKEFPKEASLILREIVKIGIS